MFALSTFFILLFSAPSPPPAALLLLHAARARPPAAATAARRRRCRRCALLVIVVVVVVRPGEPGAGAEDLVRGAAVLLDVLVAAVLVGEAAKEGGAAQAARDVTDAVFAFSGRVG